MGTALTGRHSASKWLAGKTTSYGTPLPFVWQPRHRWRPPTPKNLWPSPCAIAYLNLTYSQPKQPFQSLQQLQAELENCTECGEGFPVL